MAYMIGFIFLVPLMALIGAWHQAKLERRRGFRHNL